MKLCMVLLVALAAALLVRTTDAAPLEQTIDYGGIVQLAGTPHIWVSEGGKLHWAGDTRALAGYYVNWGNRREMTLDQLSRYPIGDPWLSAGLLKMGDPIYLVKWETGDSAPTLLHIQSIVDVELFGINGSNYGSMILDQGAWERRVGIGAAGLHRGELAPAASRARVLIPSAECAAAQSQYQQVGLATAQWLNYLAYVCAGGPPAPPPPGLYSGGLGDSGLGGSAIGSQIAGTFEGWTGETIFALTNGQVWQQASYAYYYHYAYGPTILIYPSGGGWRLQVEGVSETIPVRRIR